MHKEVGIRSHSLPLLLIKRHLPLSLSLSLPSPQIIKLAIMIPLLLILLLLLLLISNFHHYYCDIQSAHMSKYILNLGGSGRLTLQTRYLWLIECVKRAVQSSSAARQPSRMEDRRSTLLDLRLLSFRGLFHVFWPFLRHGITLWGKSESSTIKQYTKLFY